MAEPDGQSRGADCDVTQWALSDPGSADGTVTELAKYTGGAEVACYSRTEAEELSSSIGKSETVQGRLSPRFDTTVVCGFVTKTEAVCWQDSPPDRGFIRVGGWIT